MAENQNTKTYPPADGEFMAQGSWLKTNRGLVFFCCPSCGSVNTLSDYAIDDGGVVTPDYVCTTHYCTFHEGIRLGEWAKETPPE